MESKIIGMNIAVAFVDGAVLLSPLAAIVDVNENPAAVELDPDYAAGKKAIEAKQWGAAIAATRNVDIQNYLGYAYRNAGQLDAAFRHYERALTLSPRHRGAHEYVGEAYLIVNNLAKAEEHLAAPQQDRSLQTYRRAVSCKL
jgi:tetratricopeptide (TPR) repeat protein